MEFIHEALDLWDRIWGVIVAVVAGIGGLLAWKAKNRKSSALLFDDLEEIKKRLLAQVTREVELSNSIAQKEILLNRLKLECPDCYAKAIENIG